MSETLFEEVDYDYDLDNQKEYPKTINEEDIHSRKTEILKYLDGWRIEEEVLDGGDTREYFKHDASKLKFDMIRIEFANGDSILVPRYNEESDTYGNSGYKVMKEKGVEKRVLLSETTYTIRDNGKVERMGFNDFWNSRRGKRHQKYLNYMKMRNEKKRVYQQEQYKRQRQKVNINV
jgi:hypothetical protein